VTDASSQPQPSIDGLQGDEQGSRIVAEELRLLAIVHEALESQRRGAATADQARALDERRLLELRDDVAVAKPEDLPALFEQMHNLGALRAQRGRGQEGSIDLRAPYFAHLRLVENGKRRDVLIGARSYVDSAAGIRIVDWRHAPVSKIYYRYQEGDDYEEELGDRMVEGTVLARRNVAIANGQLVRVASPQGVFVNKGGHWSRIAAHRSKLVVARPEGEAPRLGVGADFQPRQDRHLPEIAAMLDAEQFALITRPSSGLVAIQGSAGSGKTTVGLHRAAYLAAADPRRFRPDRILIVVPNEALRHYVGRVLPSLGVEGVAITTFARFARRVLPDLLPKMPLAVSDTTPPVVARAKSHPAMLKAMTVLQAQAMASADARLRDTMRRWPDGDLAIRAWDALASFATPDARVAALGQWLAGKRRLEPSPARLPDVTRSALEKLVAEARLGPRAVVHAWDELTTSRERLGETFANVPGFGPGQLDQVHSWCVRQARVRSEGERDGEHPTLDLEDHALLLRLWQLLRGPVLAPDGSPVRFAHLFIDEVQDASPIELRVLVDLCDKEQCITLAGDTAQRMLAGEDLHADGTEFDWNGLLDELGVPHMQLAPLKVSYRSTAEITSFARGVLGPYAHEAEPIATRHGPPVELFEFVSPGEAVAFLADALRQLAVESPDANVALLSRFGPQADIYYEGLLRAEVPNVRRVTKQDFTWEPGFDVTDVRQTKGLEFDEVVLLDVNASSYPDNSQARHTLYVGATRAAHQLWCTTSDAVSPIVRGALGDLSNPRR